ncbi:hypothetical protein OG565_24300 [Streptomyces sp. NBC_00138]|nr:hypothetical protein [Streptomyces sp. NBC_00223]
MTFQNGADLVGDTVRQGINTVVGTDESRDVDRHDRRRGLRDASDLNRGDEVDVESLVRTPTEAGRHRNPDAFHTLHQMTGLAQVEEEEVAEVHSSGCPHSLQGGGQVLGEGDQVDIGRVPGLPQAGEHGDTALQDPPVGVGSGEAAGQQSVVGELAP